MSLGADLCQWLLLPKIGNEGVVVNDASFVYLHINLSIL